MTVVDVTPQPDELMVTFMCEFAATPEQVWQVWADPRLLERWWGPPGYPATIVEHELALAAVVSYYMTGPEGERYPGGFQILAASPPTSLSFEDYFTDESGARDTSMPSTRTDVEIETRGEALATMKVISAFPSREAMEEYSAMGAVEGMAAALGQIDGLLASSAQ